MKSDEIGSIHVNHFDALFTGGIIDNVFASTAPVEYRDFRLVFERLEVHKPYISPSNKAPLADRRLLPWECRERGLTYGGPCFLKMKLFYKHKLVFDDFKPAGDFPIMLRSHLCHTAASSGEIRALGEDPQESGGYFIVAGYDRLVRFHIAYKRNHLFALKTSQKDPAYSPYSCMIRSVGPDELGHKNEVKLCEDGNIHVKLYCRKRTYYIPVVLMLKSLVEVSDREIFESLGSDQRVLNFLSRTDVRTAFSQRECLVHLGQRFRAVLRIDDPEECGRELLRCFFFVHLHRFEEKYSLLLDAVRRLLLLSNGTIVPDDIDIPSSHEVYSEMQLFALCIREKLEEIKRHFRQRIISALRIRLSAGEHSTASMSTSEAQETLGDLSEDQVAQIIKSFHSIDFSIGAKLARFLSTGNISVNSCSDILQTAGFTLLAERINYWRFASHFQSISRGGYFATVKISRVRKLRPEGWGFICPIHTPDGTPCGILLHLARGCDVRASSQAFPSTVLYEFGLVPDARNMPALYASSPCFLNGRLCGWTTCPAALAASLRNYRSIHGISAEICYESGPGIRSAIYIYDGPGSMMRRVLNLRTGNTDWIGIREQVFLNIKLSEYKSKDNYPMENNRHNSNRTPDIDTIYKEIDNTLIFSTVAASIPFADHNPSPRNIYQCQMAKQAMGIPAYNMKSRTDNKSYRVNYLQAPMVQSVGYASMEPFPIGFNCIVAVLSYTAYDMEDAVVINKSACDRGLFSACIYKCERFELDKHSEVEYTPEIGSVIEPGDVLLQYSNEDTGNGTKKYEGTERGVVEAVKLYDNGTPGVTVTIRINRNPMIGDKFCSRHGQKGVMSALWREVDMPFTEQGLRPDIIINPHAFPSRMTIAMLLESMCGKVALSSGEVIDATPFARNAVFDDTHGDAGTEMNIGEELAKYGFNFYGNEPMYSGTAGTEFRTDVFIGSVFYQRLRHMVNDKFQVRTSGSVVSTTRQPVGGRKNKGGMRFGEMERDALIAHGTSFLLKDRLLDCSDRTEFQCCKSCGSILFVQAQSCRCKNSKLHTVELPYVFKYLCCELMAMNIRVKLDVKSVA